MERLLPYLAGILRSEGCTPHAVNGYRDHVHAVFGFPPRLAVSDVVRQLKGSSSAWVHREMAKRRDFAWQDGCAVYSVSPGRLSQAVRYVETQEEHHRLRSFEEEYLEFLALGGIEFDKRYVFDGEPAGRRR